MINISIPNLSGFVSKDQLSKIPQKQGLYVLYNTADDLLYIGKSKNLHARVTDHINGRTNTKDFCLQFHKIRYFEEDNPLYLDIYETYLISTWNPKYNLSKVYDCQTIDDSFVFIDDVMQKTTRIQLSTLNHILSENQLPTVNHQDSTVRERFAVLGLRIEGLCVTRTENWVEREADPTEDVLPLPEPESEQLGKPLSRRSKTKSAAKKRRKPRAKKTLNVERPPKVQFFVRNGKII